MKKITFLIILLFLFGCDKEVPTTSSENTAKNLDLAIYMGDLTEVKNIIERDGFDVNSIIDTEYKERPIHIASYYGRTNIIEYFINNGASIDEEDLSNHKTAFLIAISKKNEDTALALLRLGANPNVETRSGISSCEMAIRVGLYDVAKKIPNCDITRKNNCK